MHRHLAETRKQGKPLRLLTQAGVFGLTSLAKLMRSMRHTSNDISFLRFRRRYGESERKSTGYPVFMPSEAPVPNEMPVPATPQSTSEPVTGREDGGEPAPHTTAWRIAD